MASTLIGISGWRYPHGAAYFILPVFRNIVSSNMPLRALPTIEINGTFYSLQRPESFKHWYEETPPGFVFSVKGARYITHIRRLRDIDAPLANFFASGLFNLREKLGPFLWQFPPSFRYDPERMKRFFELLPKDTEEALSLARRRERRMAAASGWQSRLSAH